MTPRDRTTETDDSYERLRRAILGGQFMPNERLMEVELAGAFGVGRAAIRTALARLEQDGLVEREPFRGARVRSISEEEAIEILEARTALEALVARHAAAKATEAHVLALRATVQQMSECLLAEDLPGISELSGQLHDGLLAAASHRVAARLIDNLQAQNVRHQFRTALVPGRAARSVAEHRAIVEAVAAHDADAAEAATREHLSNVTEALRRAKNAGVARLSTLV